jgi:hypothetical protein
MTCVFVGGCVICGFDFRLRLLLLIVVAGSFFLSSFFVCVCVCVCVSSPLLHPRLSVLFCVFFFFLSFSPFVFFIYPCGCRSIDPISISLSLSHHISLRSPAHPVNNAPPVLVLLACTYSPRITSRIISNPNSPVALLHKAVLCLLLLCVQLLPTCTEDGLESEVVRALELLLRDLPVEARRTLAPKIGLALSHLVEELASDHLAGICNSSAVCSPGAPSSASSTGTTPPSTVNATHSSEGGPSPATTANHQSLSPRVWRAVFGLMSACAIHPIAADRCFRALTALSRAWCPTSFGQLPVCAPLGPSDTSAAQIAAVADEVVEVVVEEQQQQQEEESGGARSVLCEGSNFASITATLLAFARSTDCGPSLPIRALDLLFKLYSSAELRPHFSVHADAAHVWQLFVAPLIEGLHLLCTDARRAVRLAALTHLNRALLLPELQQLAPPAWMPCFDQVCSGGGGGGGGGGV